MKTVNDVLLEVLDHVNTNVCTSPKHILQILENNDIALIPVAAPFFEHKSRYPSGNRENKVAHNAKT